MDLNLNNVDIPEDPILRGGSTGNVVGDRISPRWQTPVGSQEVAISGLELDLGPFSDGFPLDGGIEPPEKGLEDFPAGHSEQKGLIAGREVLAVAALETDD